MVFKIKNASGLRPIGNRVIVKNVDFGEQRTKNGLIVLSDDGTDRGIRPRWGQVYAKGPSNNDEYDIDDWILIEHGRWTRGVEIDTNDKKEILRTVEAESVLLWTKERPN